MVYVSRGNAQMNKRLKNQVIADVEYVQEVLRRWDPIGVLPGPSEHEGPINEYDSYAPQLVTLLRKGASVDEIQNRLVEIRTMSMGLPTYPEKDRLAAEQLVSWWRNRN